MCVCLYNFWYDFHLYGYLTKNDVRIPVYYAIPPFNLSPDFEFWERREGQQNEETEKNVQKRERK